jgi:UDPglucose 6-dehydrogenase
MTKVALVGVGKLGLDCGEVLAEHHSVIGFDLEARSPANFPMAKSIDEAVSNARFVLLAVQTPHDPKYGGEKPTSNLSPKDFDYSTLQEAIKAFAPFLTPSQTVVVISTVLPGTIRREIKPLLPRNPLLYNPYLIAMGSAKWDMQHPEMLIVGSDAGVEDQDVTDLITLYEPLLSERPRLAFGTWEEAEAVKIFYNTFISAKIGLVNMILDVAERTGHMDVDVVTTALRDSTQRIMGPRYMRAGLGDAGPCHPRDNIALRYLASSLDLGYDLFEAIMTSREKQAANMARRLVKLSDARGGLPIVIHGKAYKPGIHLVDGSYSLLVGHFIEQEGRTVEFVDPWTKDGRSTNGPAVFLLAHNPSVAYAVNSVNAAGMPKLYCDIPRDSVILDPWRQLAPIEGVHVVAYGNTRPAAASMG